jgi:hypothetical protein
MTDWIDVQTGENQLGRGLFSLTPNNFAKRIWRFNCCTNKHSFLIGEISTLSNPKVCKMQAGELTDILLEFLHVTIHQILFVREIYPAEVFAPAKKYGIPVRMSRHPDLNQYIRDSLVGLRSWIDKVGGSYNYVHHLGVTGRD